jgi:hypothetical protein
MSAHAALQAPGGSQPKEELAVQANDNEPYRLTFDDAVAVWDLHLDGVYQHKIAARFGVNPGRVNEVLKGHKHSGSEQVARARRSAA